jgi:hypothetical protein
VCLLLTTRGYGCNGHPAFPAPSLGGERLLHNSGASCRENAEMCVKIGAASLRANGSRECAPDDRLREAIHRAAKGRMDCVASLAMTIHSLPPAEAGDPVFRGVSDGSDIPRRTGYSAGACHRARRRRDPVAEYDGSLWSSGCLKIESGSQAAEMPPLMLMGRPLMRAAWGLASDAIIRGESRSAPCWSSDGTRAGSSQHR